jgi:hypothetical protein
MSELEDNTDPMYHIRESELKYILSHNMEDDDSGIELLIRSRTHSEIQHVVCQVCHKTHNCCQNATRNSREDTLKEVYQRLEPLSYQDWEGGSKIPVVDWSDIDCLFAELGYEHEQGGSSGS